MKQKALGIIFVTITSGILIGAPAQGASIVMPIASVTPGAVDTSITQANIGSTICISGYTKTVRPPTSYTTKLKRQQLRGTYKRYHDTVTSHFEEDHLIALAIGGSPTSVKNLWPEPYAGSTGARVKDKVELKLHTLVCSGRVPLKTAQKAMAKNWYAAYLKYKNW